jgi:exonuclease SbcC
MRIERVVARAFGPFRGQTLELAEGMTVVVGPNEAGKSTWHAAARLAITGIRRGRGRATAADAAVEARHRPWDQPEQWEVEARLALDDGRSIDISQDLAGKVACRAWDVALGRDVSDEIVDGTPDASRWLGLDRESFAATVSVSQAQILAVADAADQLQDHMQRAAATRGTEATAAEAITRLEEFRRQAVGADTIAAKGPLRAAKSALAAAEEHLAEARRLHDAYLSQGQAAEAAERAAAAARTRLAIAEAAVARRAADDAARRLSQASELAARHPSPPATLAARDEAADAVAASIEAWTSRPPERDERDGPSARELRDELEGLPQRPQGDAAPHPTVAAAVRAYEVAHEALHAAGDARAVAWPAPLDLDEPALRELAGRLRGQEMPRGASIEEELIVARRDLASAPSPLPQAAASATTLVLAGLIGLVLSAPLVGIAFIALAIAAGGWAWLASAPRRSALARIRRAEAALAPYREAAAAAAEARQAARREAEQRGLPGDPTALEALADELRDRRRGEAWAAHRAGLEARRDTAADALRLALEGRDVAVGDDLSAAWLAYEAACAARAGQAALASRREALARDVAVREAAEQRVAAEAHLRAAAERRLRDAAAAVELDPSLGPDELVASLLAWQAERAALVHAGQVAITEWERLQALLGDGSLEELRAEALNRQQRAETLAAGLGNPAGIELGAEGVQEDIGALRHEVSRLEREASELVGSLGTRGEGLPDVAEAEEQADAARRELQRVESLARTLDETLRLLRDAEDRVHRSLAPILAAAVTRWLPVVCDGAYEEVSVDPADLAIMVKEASTGQWRQAKLLSEGTREQIYLLLRVAMAQHLVITGETAPLLLDEVTAQADADRKRQLLAVLHHLSRERQIVLFTHDDEVAEWADRTLEAPRDAVVRLPRPVTSASIPVLRPVAIGS